MHMCSFNHKADARVTSRLVPSKSCLHWLWPTIKEGVKLEAPSPPSPNNTPDRPAAPPHHHHKHGHASPPTHSHPPPSPSCSALPLPLSTTTRPSASFLSEVSSPPPSPSRIHPPPSPDTHSRPRTQTQNSRLVPLPCCLQVLLGQHFVRVVNL